MGNEEKKFSLSTIWTEFTQSTGFHGVNKIIPNTDLSKRDFLRSIIWIVLWLLCAIYVTVTVVIELRRFYSYPTYSNTYAELREKLPFPTVTICNLSPTRRSAFKNDSKSLNLHLCGSPLLFFCNAVNWSDPYFSNEGYFNKRTIEDIYNESKNVSNFLYYATFDTRVYGNAYSQSLFYPVITDMGLCLRANAHGTLETEKHGALFNLQSYMNVMIDENYFSYSTSSGIKIAIHDSNQEPFMVNEGIVLQSATEAFIEIRRKEFKYLPSPYTAFGNTTCRNDKKYSNSRCFRNCIRQRIIEECGCDEPLFQGSGPFCSYYQFINCSSPLFWELITSGKSNICNCPLECETTLYDYSLSTGSYPSDFLVPHIATFVNEDADYIGKNFILVKIYYKDLSVLITEQIPKYETTGAIFANLGGQIGLFLGASLLTIVEFAELVLFILYFLIQKIKRKVNITDHVMEEQK